jgi:cytochrome P450
MSGVHSNDTTGPSHAGARPRAPQAAPKISPIARGLPLVGVAPQLFLDAPGTLTRIAHAHPGEIPTLLLGPARVALVTKPDHVQYVLGDAFRTFGKGESMWRALEHLLGRGLVTSQGDLWQRQRRLMQPLFGAKQLAALAGAMVEAAEHTASRLAPVAGTGRAVHVDAEMLQITQAVILQTLFGASLDREEMGALGEAVMAAFRAINVRLFLFMIPRWIPMPGDRTVVRAVDRIDTSLLRLVGARRRSGEQRSDMLALLMQARDEEDAGGMDDRQLRDELVTLFVAGNETTALLLTWTWWLLDAHPEVDRRLRDELASVLGGRSPTADDLPRLVYTKMVIQEVLRLYPPAWILPRFAAHDAEIDGYRIPAGSTVLLCPYATHRDPSIWDRPDAFDPERFTPERAAARHRYAYFPFGGGARQCIGNVFAIMEAQIILAVWMQRFRMRLAPEHPPVVPHAATTLRSKHGVRMTVTRA